MLLTPDNQYLLDLWVDARGENTIPHVNPSLFTRDGRIGKNTSLQFMAPDKMVRFAYAGRNVEKLLGIDLTGMAVTDLFKDSEKKQMHDMQELLFSHPIIPYSQSNTMTLGGDMIQVEMLQLPFINKSVNELVYVTGSFEWTHESNNSNISRLRDRALLYRTMLDVKTLKPIESEYTYPVIEGMKGLELTTDTVELL